LEVKGKQIEASKDGINYTEVATIPEKE